MSVVADAVRKNIGDPIEIPVSVKVALSQKWARETTNEQEFLDRMLPFPLADPPVGELATQLELMI